MRKAFILLVGTLLLLPLATALNCNSLGGGDLIICKFILDSNLTNEEKDLLILDIFNKNKIFPDHDFVYSWNTALDIRNSPESKYTSQGAIKNAWISIISLMPSITENETLYVPEQGEILTKYGYNVQLPSGTALGDCKTYYSLEDKNERLYLYLNSRLIGQDELSSFSLMPEEKELNFIARLKIDITYKVVHYRNKRYCVSYEDGTCVEYRTTCEYSSTNYQTDTLTLTDNLNAESYRQKPESNFKIINKYNGITQGVLTARNFTNLFLNFKDSRYENNKYVYSYDYRSPYYILTLKAEPFEQETGTNIHVDKSGDNFTFTIKDIENCEVELQTHFESVTKQCTLNYNPIDFEIKTNKINYYENETIRIEILPKDTEIQLTYNNETITAKNNAEFKAVLYENKITAKAEDKVTDKIINVKSLENKKIILNFLSLSLIAIITYSLIKKYYIKNPAL